MPSINLCFLWHMHQPLYKDLARAEYRLPWTRLHALKDYFGMVKILDDFPVIRQTFNLVPSLLLQIEDYAAGRASDPFLALALKPAEELEQNEKERILQYFFQATEESGMRKYSRFAELNEWKQRHQYSVGETTSSFTATMLRDLQVLSQLVWFDEFYLQNDADLQRLVRKGRDYTVEDQRLLGEKEAAVLGSVLNAYQQAANRGQIEISTSPMYHPILPLLCDTNIASIAHPYAPLPNRFCWPQDATEQMLRARAYIKRLFGTEPAGLWPPEGAVSDTVLALAAECGFQWTASCHRVLARTLEEAPAEAAQTGSSSAPYVWRQGERSIDVVFRDDRLSDLIGFVYSRMDPVEAAAHFVGEVHKTAASLMENGRDALIAIVLDGENAWETYAENGRPFLRELYSRIEGDESIRATTVSGALTTTEGQELRHIFPGSWTDASFDTWIGGAEHNVAWEHLRKAREALEEAAAASAASREFAKEELLVAEGSDWFWCYNSDFSSPNKGDFDRLFRDRLSNVYRALDLTPPESLSHPIARAVEAPAQQHPNGLIQPVVDGLVTSAGEWSHAGRYRGEMRSAAMHRPFSFARDFFYGSDGRHMYFRVDLSESVDLNTVLTFYFRMRTSAGDSFVLSVTGKPFQEGAIETDVPGEAVEVAIGAVCEAKVSLSAMRVRLGEALYVRVQVFRDGLPVAAVPTRGEMELGAGVMAAYAY